MPGTKAGGAKAAATNKLRYGNDFYVQMGRRGGSKGAKDGAVKGFAADRERARNAGAKGGRISKRTKAVKEEPIWSIADDMETSIADSIAMERGKSWRERMFG